MSTPQRPPPDEARRPRDAANWAKPVSELKVTGDVPTDALTVGMQGKQLAGLAGGFGKMWQKTYRVALTGLDATPAEVIKVWKERFPQFWPKGNRFYGPLTGIAPGEVALLNLSMGGVKLSTGIMVIYADEESFSFMNPQGHMFHGMITFSAFVEDGVTVAQAQALIRAQDPLFELAMTFGGHRKEDRFWLLTLAALAAHLGCEDAEPDKQRVCVDRRRQWRQARNIKHNSAIRSGAYMMGAPFRAIAKPFRRKRAA
jgi:hypothetical protein